MATSELPLFLEARHLATVRQVLAKVVPGRRVWAFGSRATGRHVWRYSDLDLAVDGALTVGERATLAEEFEESLLPVLVDVVELGLVDAEFAERIRPDFQIIQEGGGDQAGHAAA